MKRLLISGIVGRLIVRTRRSNVSVRVMNPLPFKKIASEETLYYQSTYHRLGWLVTGVRARVGEPGVDSELSSSSDEADCGALVGAGTSEDPEASSDHETPKEPDAPSSFVADQKVCRSVCAPHQTGR